jgi:hypothetical protein
MSPTAAIVTDVVVATADPPVTAEAPSRATLATAAEMIGVRRYMLPPRATVPGTLSGPMT